MDRINKADCSAGLLFIVFGLGFGITALDLEMGTTFRMGPGYFPMVLAVLLTGLGLAITNSSLGSRGDAVANYASRGMVVILAAPVFFGLTVRGLGFVPSIFMTTLIAALGGLKLRPLQAVVLAGGVTILRRDQAALISCLIPSRNSAPWMISGSQFCLVLRCLTVANLLSMGFVVRICFECPAGKLWNARRPARSLIRHFATRFDVTP